MRNPSGSRASAYARVCAWKSRLLGRLEAPSLMLASDATAMQRAISTLGFERRYDRLLRVYGMVLRAYPDVAPLFRSLIRLHEIENLKLLWRAIMRRRDRRATQRLWIPLGSLATIPADAIEAMNLRGLTERLSHSQFGSIATDVSRAYHDDLGAAELAFDRWASLQLLREARLLPKNESLTRRLVEIVVRRRDSEILRRGERWFGLSPAAARAATATPGKDPARDPAAMRTQQLRLCRRAFVGDPFAIAPAVALVLLAEEELRAVRALIERQGDPLLDAATARAMSGAQFGS